MKIFEVTPDPSDHPIRKYAQYVKKTYYGVVNVSDTPCMTFEYQNNGIKALWFPIHEVGQWGYSPFYGTAKFLDQKLASGDERPILIHCHAGANRSVCVAYAVLKSVESTQAEIDHKLEIGEGLPNLFQININKGYIPSDIIEFLKARHKNPSYAIHGLLQIIGSPNLHVRKDNQKSIKFNGVEL
jgi:hypothetical protein